jgi:hypothetical protein
MSKLYFLFEKIEMGDGRMRVLKSENESVEAKQLNSEPDKKRNSTEGRGKDLRPVLCSVSVFQSVVCKMNLHSVLTSDLTETHSLLGKESPVSLAS